MVNLFRRMANWALSVVSGPWPVSQGGGLAFTQRQSHAGVHVTEEGSLSLSAVFSGVSLLSRLTGSLPLCVYQRKGRLRQPAEQHPAYRVLAGEFNPEMTAATGRSVMEFHRLLWGNSYGEIQWAGNGKVAAIWPVEPWRVKVMRDENNQLYYRVDNRRNVHPEDMIHHKLTSLDGVVGRSFVDFAVQSLGLGLATQEFAARYFGNGARPGAIIDIPGAWSEEKRKEFKRSWNEAYGGPENSGKTAVLWGGIKWIGTDGSFQPEQSQLIEQRRFNIEEVARWLNIPPHLLRDLTRATFSNIEQQGIDFVTYSIGPTLVEQEQEYNRRLLSVPATYCKHDVTGLLRGDSAARVAYFQGLFNVGAITPNEIREAEDMNPEPDGDERYIPLNMQALGAEPEEPEPDADDPPAKPGDPNAKTPADPAPSPPEDKSDAAAAMRGLVGDTLARMLKVESTALLRAAEKPSGFLAWADDYYAKHEPRLAEALAPIGVAAARVGLRPLPSALAGQWCGESRAEILDLTGTVKNADLSRATAEMLDRWDLIRPRRTVRPLWALEQDRDENGRWAGDGESSEGADEGESDYDRENRREDEDRDVAEAREAEDDATTDQRTEEDDAIGEAREKEDAQHEKEDAKVETGRDKEDAKTEASREKEDAQTEKGRDKEDAKIEKDLEKVEASRDKEDSQTEASREKEDTQTEAGRDREDAATEAKRDQADAAEEKSRDAEDKATEARRSAEDGDEDPSPETESKREAEDKATQNGRDLKDKADGMTRAYEDRVMAERRDAENKTAEARRDAEDKATQGKRVTEDNAYQATVTATVKQRDAEDKATEAKRVAEGKGAQSKRDDEDNARSEARDAKREAEDKASQVKREKEDAARDAKREAEDKDRQEDRQKQDKLQARISRMQTLYSEDQPRGDDGKFGSGSGKSDDKDDGKTNKEGKDIAANRPSKPDERHVNEDGSKPGPKAIDYQDPPPKTGVKGGGQITRPTGDAAQGVVGDQGESLAQELGFRNILPEGKRSFTAAEKKAQGSSIDLEYDHSGRLYELKTCNTTSTEYRNKASKDQKEQKERYAKGNDAEAWMLVGVRDVEKKEIHYYAAKEKGLTGAEVSSKGYDYLGKVSYK